MELSRISQTRWWRPGGADAADVHAGTLADRLEPFENGDVFRGVGWWHSAWFYGVLRGSAGFYGVRFYGVRFYGFGSTGSVLRGSVLRGSVPRVRFYGLVLGFGSTGFGSTGFGSTEFGSTGFGSMGSVLRSSVLRSSVLRSSVLRSSVTRSSAGFHRVLRVRFYGVPQGFTGFRFYRVRVLRSSAKFYRFSSTGFSPHATAADRSMRAGPVGAGSGQELRSDPRSAAQKRRTVGAKLRICR